MRERIFDWFFWLCQKTGHLLQEQKTEYGTTWKACRLCGSTIEEIKDKP